MHTPPFFCTRVDIRFEPSYDSNKMRTPATTTMTLTNSNNAGMAAYLADATGNTTFTAVIYTKVGKQVGRGAARKFYGRDTVMDTIVTGFNYMTLVDKDRKKIDTISAETLRDACVAAGALDKLGDYPGLAACRQALDEQAAAFDRTLAGVNPSTTDDVRQPLVVNGETIPGCWVNDGSVDRAKTGAAYLYGLRVGRKVIERDVNGPIPASKSAANVVAKNELKKMLRIGRWCMVKLEADTILKIGGSAAALADQHGVVISDDDLTVREVYDAHAAG